MEMQRMKSHFEGPEPPACAKHRARARTPPQFEFGWADLHG